MRLNDKVAIITGAANGIGVAHATRFAAEGAIVVLADIDADGAARVAAEIGGRASASRVDIADQASCDALVEEVKAAHGRIDVLLNNAAIYRGVLLFDTTPEYLDKIAQVNLWGAWRMTRSVARVMVAQGAGGIINQSSDAAYMPTIYPMETELPTSPTGSRMGDSMA